MPSLVDMAGTGLDALIFWLILYAIMLPPSALVCWTLRRWL